MKKMLIAAAMGLALTFNAAPQVEAYSSSQAMAEEDSTYLGVSNATGWKCFILPDSISLDVDVVYATLKMVDGNNRARYLDYTFFLPPDAHTKVRFRNEDGFEGAIHPKATPIEWKMYVYIDEHYFKR